MKSQKILICHLSLNTSTEINLYLKCLTFIAIKFKHHNFFIEGKCFHCFASVKFDNFSSNYTYLRLFSFNLDVKLTEKPTVCQFLKVFKLKN